MNSEQERYAAAQQAATEALVSRIWGNRDLERLLDEEMTGKHRQWFSAALMEGPYVFHLDPGFTTPKADRDKSRKDIRAAARKLAAELRQTPCLDLAWKKVREGEGDPQLLTDYLESLAAQAGAQTLANPELYPPEQSKTAADNPRPVLLRHIKLTVYKYAEHIKTKQLNRFAADVANAVLDPSLTEKTITEATMEKI